MVRKAFFRTRTVAEIRDMQTRQAYHQHGLVETVDGLGENEALILRAQVVPGRFYIPPRGKKAEELSSGDASRKAIRWGEYILIDHPKTREACDLCTEIPLRMRERALDQLREMREEDINAIGIEYHPDFGDRQARRFPFVNCAEAQRIDAYATRFLTWEDSEGKKHEGIKVRAFADAGKVRKDGAIIVGRVPSREDKGRGYTSALAHVPVVRDNANLATILQMRPIVPTFLGDIEELNYATPHELYIAVKYAWPNERRRGDEIIFSPQDIARYMANARYFLGQHNMTPMEMTPMPLYSRHGAEFAMKLMNQVLIFDPRLGGKDKLRELNLAEKSVLLARAIGKFGHNDFAYWDPSRDGRPRDYEWSLKT